MGRYWLHDLPAEAAKRGLTIDTYPGWELRSRSSGGLDDIRAVCMHHTASNTAPENDMRWQYETSSIAPIGNISLHRDGKVVIGAAGAANTQGKGGPFATSKGLVPLNAGNRYMIAIEACNNGIGELWPEAQIRSYVHLVAILCEMYELNPLTDVLSHFEWTSRKIDPAGPTEVAPSWSQPTDRYQRWDMNSVRLSILETVAMGIVPESSDFKITNPVRIVDTINGADWNPYRGVIPSGSAVRFAPRAGTRDDAKGVLLSVAGVGNEVRGFFTIWDGQGSAPPVASTVNVYPGMVQNSFVAVPLWEGKFSVFAGGPNSANHIIIDQVGWYW